MTNQELAKIFYEMSVLLGMKGIAFKPRAYEEAASSLEALEEDVRSIYKREGLSGLDNIPAVGKGIARDIEHFIIKGTVPEYNRLKREFPIDITGLSAVEGIGPKLMLMLYQERKIKTVADLEKSARAGRLKGLPHMGEKLEQKILKSIAFLKSSHGRMGIGEARPLALHIEERLKRIPSVKRVELAGSLRRWQETIGDLDFLVIADDPEKVMNVFKKMPEVVSVTGSGEQKCLSVCVRG